MRLLMLLLVALPCLAEDGLLTIRRVFVDNLNGNGAAVEMRDLLIAALQNTKRFQLTENAERADVFLRGTANEDVFTETYHSSDNVNARAYLGSAKKTGSSATNRLPDVSVGENESTIMNERKHQSIATVRLVNKDGDVLWSTTKESGGAKFRGSNADVADKIVKQLLSDIDITTKPKT